jgi:hypothetical protein
MAALVLARRAAAKVLSDQIAAADMSRKEQVAAEGLVKLMNSPAKQEITVTPKNAAEYAKNLAIQERNWNSFIKKRAEQLTTRDAIAELFTLGQTDLALLMFRPERVALWQTNYNLVRDIFEIAPVPSQCNNTIFPFVAGTTPCWICGMVIPFATADLHCGHENGLAGECEHILPIAQAAMFLQLYDAKNKADLDIYKLEYAWSHKLCNRTKNDDVYFRPELDTTGIPIVDDNAFEKLLTRIYNSDRVDATCEGHPEHSFKKLLQEYVAKKTVKGWKAAQRGEFIVRYGRIIKFVGGTNFKAAPEIYLLALAAAPASIVTRLDPTRRATLGYGGRRRKRRTRRRYHAIRTSSRRRPVVGMADSF